MNSNRISGWLTLGANIGVVIGIGLLIVELDQNRDMMRSQTRHQIAIEDANFFLATAYDPDMTARIEQVSDGEQLEATERMQYSWRLAGWFRLQENIHYQARNGLFDQSEFEGIKNTWKTFVTTSPGVEKVWCFWRMNSSKEFREDFDDLFDDLGCVANSD